MVFYDLPKEQRKERVRTIEQDLMSDLEKKTFVQAVRLFADEDTYIRKTAYLYIGKCYKAEERLRKRILAMLSGLMESEDFKVRQTVINGAGEIGKFDFGVVQHFFDTGLFDPHHAPRNAVIGSIKKMGEKNPTPVLKWAALYLSHPDKEIRREICHGIELRGRKHPGDILPLLRKLEFDRTARVRNTLVHVLGQIAYKENCLQKVVKHLKSWKNQELVQEALLEIVDVHRRYRDFSYFTQAEAKKYISENF